MQAHFLAAGSFLSHMRVWIVAQDPNVQALKPESGPTAGGTYVEIFCVNLDAASASLGEISCRFNTTIVPATLASSTLLQCIAPKHAEGYVDVDIAMQGHDFSSAGVQFHYQACMRTPTSFLTVPVECCNICRCR